MSDSTFSLFGKVQRWVDIDAVSTLGSSIQIIGVRAIGSKRWLKPPPDKKVNKMLAIDGMREEMEQPEQPTASSQRLEEHNGIIDDVLHDQCLHVASPAPEHPDYFQFVRTGRACERSAPLWLLKGAYWTLFTLCPDFSSHLFYQKTRHKKPAALILFSSHRTVLGRPRGPTYSFNNRPRNSAFLL